MKPYLIAIAGLFALPACADNVGLPASTSAAYTSECGGCHAPFPPGLLSAGDWKKTMAALDKHFGSDASLDPKPAAEIAAWLERNAGRRATSSASGEPRITATAWFKREHREVVASAWKNPRVKSPANCGACHKGADRGRYGERELAVAGMNSRHDAH